jgi:hypothetical protein
LPIQKADAEKVATKGAQITRELMVLECKGVSPDDVRVSGVNFRVMKLANTILDWPRLFGRKYFSVEEAQVYRPNRRVD